MQRQPAPRISPWLLCAGTAFASAALVASCTYDFDAPFAETPSGTGTATATAAGGGGMTSSTGNTGGAGTGVGPTGGSAGTGGTGQGGSTGGEICFNGQDDDGDQLIDCADSECQLGWECAVLAGSLWSEPLAFYRGDDALPRPDCPAPFATESDYGIGLSGDPASCASCSCDGSELCSVEGTDAFTVGGCGSAPYSHFPSAIGVCDPWSMPDFDSAYGGDSDPVGGGCTTSGGAVTNLPALEYQEHVRLCEGSLQQGQDGGCGNDSQVCVPLPTAEFARCVTRTGDQTCLAPYTQKTLVYRTVDDQRGCAACSCSDPLGVTCTSAVTLFYRSNDCSGSVYAAVDNDGSCQDFMLGSATDGSARFTVTPSYSGCNTSGGSPTGSATGTDPLTVCCLPSG